MQSTEQALSNEADRLAWVRHRKPLYSIEQGIQALKEEGGDIAFVKLKMLVWLLVCGPSSVLKKKTLRQLQGIRRGIL